MVESQTGVSEGNHAIFCFTYLYNFDMFSWEFRGGGKAKSRHCMGSGMECYENLRRRATWKQFNMKCNYQIRLSWKEHAKATIRMQLT